MVLTSLSCSPVVQSPPTGESSIPRECAIKILIYSIKATSETKGDVEKCTVPFGSQCWGSCLLQRYRIAARTVLGWRWLGTGTSVTVAPMGAERTGTALAAWWGNPAHRSRPMGPGSPAQESQTREHRPVTPFFRDGFIPQESNAAEGIKITGRSRGKCACPSAGCSPCAGCARGAAPVPSRMGRGKKMDKLPIIGSSHRARCEGFTSPSFHKKINRGELLLRVTQPQGWSVPLRGFRWPPAEGGNTCPLPAATRAPCDPWKESGDVSDSGSSTTSGHWSGGSGISTPSPPHPAGSPKYSSEALSSPQADDGFETDSDPFLLDEPAPRKRKVLLLWWGVLAPVGWLWLSRCPTEGTLVLGRG